MAETAVFAYDGSDDAQRRLTEARVARQAQRAVVVTFARRRITTRRRSSPATVVLAASERMPRTFRLNQIHESQLLGCSELLARSS
jgi:hypothetical protein